MKTLEALNVIEENIITEEESLEEQLIHLMIAKDEILAMIKEFQEDELTEKLNEINEKIKQVKKLLN